MTETARPRRPRRHPMALCLALWLPLALPTSARAEGPTEDIAAAQAEAKLAFERGYVHMQRKAFDAALAEFERSRALYPTKGNTRNAAVCLDQLGRHDEALDRLDALLRDFPSLEQAERDAIGREVARLRGLVGFLEIRADVPGARVVIDGRERATTPLSAPLRLSTGTHALRVVREGHAVFEDRVTVAAGQIVTVDAKLPALVRQGRLRVLTAAGAAPAKVSVDGLIVGTTPWDGALAPGRHVVSLDGGGDLGTPPVSVDVREDQPATLSLAVERLRAHLRIDPVPRTAAVAIDGVTMGYGPWEGRLRAGEHVVEVSAEGFLTLRRALSIAEDGREQVRLPLTRDPLSPFWGARARSRLMLDLSLGGALAARGAGGDLATCSGCDAGLGHGGRAFVGGLYALPSGGRFGVEVGAMALRMTAKNADARIAIGPSRAPGSAQTEDALAFDGMLVGAVAGLAPPSWSVVELRLGAGVLFGSVRDERVTRVEGVTTTAAQSSSASYARLSPEVRAALYAGERLAIRAGLAATALVALSAPRWDPAKRPIVVPSVASQAEFSAERTSGAFVVLIEPSVSASYTF